MSNLFATAKKTETKTSASTKPKERITVAGMEADINRYNQIKKDEANLKSEKEMIGARLKDIGKEEFMQMYLKQKSRPDSFNLVDGEERILFIVMDAYKKVEEAKEAMLAEYDCMETKTTYSINPELLEKCGEAISKAINSSKLISDEDKANIILCTEKKGIRKGTIDRLMQFANPIEVFALIEPTVTLK